MSKTVITALALVMGLLLAAVLWLREGGPAAAPALGPAPVAPPVSSTNSPVVEQAEQALGPAEPVDGQREPHSERAEVPSAAAVNWDQEARTFLASARPNGDVGMECVVRALREQLDGVGKLPTPPGYEGVARDPFAERVATAEEIEANQRINPAGVRLSPEERSQLAGLLSEFGGRLRDAKRNTFLACQISLGEAIQAGDFVVRPKGDPEDVLGRTQREAKARFENPTEFNFTTIAGSDHSHSRIVVLQPRAQPKYFQALRAERGLQAEYEVTVRMFFVSSRR